MTRKVSNPSAAFMTIYRTHKLAHTPLTQDMTHLALRGADDGRQPAALARVHEEEHRVVLVDELLELRDVRLRLLDRRGGYRVAGHGYAEAVPGRVLHGAEQRVSRVSSGRARAWVRTTPGKIFLRFSAAHAALGFPPLRQSSNWKSGWRTGFEKDTRAESTKVIVRTPQACIPQSA